jgi:uncharacterized protein
MVMSKEQQKSPQRVPVSSRRLRLSNNDGTQGVLLGMVCNDCGTHFFGSLRFCLKCTSANLKQVELSKKGNLYTYTIVRMPPPKWQGAVPYILGVVKLPEGPRVISEVLDCPEEAIKIGMPMELILRIGGTNKEGNEVVVYKWRPISK